MTSPLSVKEVGFRLILGGFPTPSIKQKVCDSGQGKRHQKKHHQRDFHALSMLVSSAHGSRAEGGQ